MTRTLEDILKGVSEKMAKRPTTEIKTDNPACVCENRYYFVRRLSSGSRTFEVCPQCNPRAACKVCHGTGNIISINPSTGNEEIIPNHCECLIWEQRVARLNSAGIPEKYLLAEFSFDNIRYGKKHLDAKTSNKFEENQAQIRNFCEHADTIIKQGVNPGDKYFLSLVGPVGTGKTYFAICALKDLILNFGHSGRFIDFQSLLNKIRDSYSKKTSEDDIMNPLRNTDVLLIDEFGKGRTENEWEIEKLDDLVNSRYNAGRVTIITSNYLPPELLKENIRQTPHEAKPKSTSNQWFLQDDSARNQRAESYWTVTLPERIGERMYDRILEASLFINFTGIPSFRKSMAGEFLERVQKEST
jgi:DNA replication protein DnaC